MGDFMRHVLLGGLLLVILADPARAQDSTPERLALINGSLRRWLALAQADAPFLIIDGASDQVRLHHRGALLRVCPAQLPAQLPADTTLALMAHLRDLRPAGPYDDPDPGPFDWERYLADGATDDSALLLTDETLIFSTDVWTPAAAAIRLAPQDLRALYDALSDDTGVVVLPKGWDSGETP